MTNNELTMLDEIQQTVRDCTKKPEIYLSVQERISLDLRNSTKQLYDLSLRTKSLNNTKSQALPELIIDGFDSEQIWQQLELENNEELGRLGLEKFSRALVNKTSWLLPLQVDNNEESKNLNDDDDEEVKQFSEESDDESLSEIAESKKKLINNNVKKRRRKTEVDDKFFKLDQLDEFLRREDKKELHGKKQDNASSDEDNESIDLFNNILESDDEEEEDQEDNELENKRSFKYRDFFDSPENSGEEEENFDKEGSENNFDNKIVDGDAESNENDSEIDNKDVDERSHKQVFENKMKRVKFNLLDNASDDELMENSLIKEQKDENGTQTVQSSLEARQERLNKKIKRLEEEAISEKPWQLKGETSALNRPQNSLLEEYVEFDTVSRPAPVMTEQTTMKLEDIIRKRIKDKAWDDVEKKFKPVETPMEYKKKLIMNQEKSKESLAQIYENEYVKQRESLIADDDEKDKEEPPEHVEIREKMYSLFTKLDALSNFHYTPKPAKPEVKIVSNLPAITMEEVAPVATSDATLLAPEEIQRKQKGDLIGKSERSKTDMKRERRKKKLKQHAHVLNKSKKVVQDIKQKKSMKKTVVSEKLKGRNIINTEEQTNTHNKPVKSSTAFFAQLQDEVKSSIKAKTNATAKKNKNVLSAVKLKL